MSTSLGIMELMADRDLWQGGSIVSMASTWEAVRWYPLIVRNNRCRGKPPLCCRPRKHGFLRCHNHRKPQARLASPRDCMRGYSGRAHGQTPEDLRSGALALPQSRIAPQYCPEVTTHPVRYAADKRCRVRLCLQGVLRVSTVLTRY